ncbi:MAG: hypothetical protein HFJ37_00175 [Clostridia bacterium]|nr:hypothetical protein [Clostridia bacterium]
MGKKGEGQTKGITLISLIIAIIVLLIIAGISIYSGKDIIKRAKLEELRTNLLLIQAKAKEYVEEANFKMGPSPDDSKKTAVRQQVYEEEAKLQKATNITAPSSIPVSECYQVTKETLKDWGLDKIETKPEEYYLIQFDDTNATVEIYHTEGYNGKYSLTEIDAIEE